jgi:hypothetical protein
MSFEIRFSVFDHAKDGIPKPRTMTWDEFVQGLGPDHRTDIEDKRRVPAFSPAEFRPGPSRKEEHVTRIWFGVLDLDMITTVQLAAVCQRLEHLDAVLYTTWGHPNVASRGLWKVRICVRFSRPVEARDWPLVWPAMSAFFCGLNDPNMNSANEIYFGPSVPPGTDLRLCHFIVFRGGALDVDQLPQVAFGENPKAPRGGTEKITRERLERLALRWKRSRDPYRSEMGETLHKVTKGEAFAEPGNRDNVLFQLCSDLAKAIPDGIPESLAEHFAHSLQLCGDNLAGDMAKVKDKFERAQEKAAAEVFAAEMAQVNERKLRIRQAWAHIDPTRETAYTEDELSAMAESCKCTREELKKRWIIQRGTLFYVLGPEGVYSQPYGRDDVWNAVLRDLAPADSAGVELWTESANGEPARKSMPSLMGEYGSVATSYVLDLRAQIASYDSVQKLFIEAPCPLRPLPPTWDRDVAMWLQILTGPHHDNVLNWLAQVTNLDLTCAALMLIGKKDTGKSLLAMGLSRLWTTEGPTSLESVLKEFNDRLARCPLTFADETLPKDFRGYGRTSEIRECLSARTRPFNKKYAPEASILGAIRLVVAANNENILSINEHLSAFDIEAIGDRFYRVPVDPRAAEWLQMCDTASFINQDRIAKHVLWLRDNYPARRDGRFLIKSTEKEFVRGLTTQSGIRSSVCQWFVGYLKSPNRIDARGDFGVMVKKGKLYVTPNVVYEGWDAYIKGEPAPNLGKLAQAITELSTRRTRVTSPKFRGQDAPHYREIDTDHLYAWSDRTEYASREDIDQALAVDTESRIVRTMTVPSRLN